MVIKKYKKWNYHRVTISDWREAWKSVLKNLRKKIHYEGEVADIIPKRISHPKIEDQKQSEKDYKVNIFKRIKEIKEKIKT